MRGRFVAVEGGDGSGKTTQAAMLAERLRAAGHEVVGTFEPGATPLGSEIRSLLLDGGVVVGARAEALLVAADRAQHVQDVVAPALARGEWVVSDRFVPSSLAYQGVGRGLPLDVIVAINRFATDGVEPDLVIVVDVPDDVAGDRSSCERDRLEAEGDAFHATVRRAYRALANEHGWALVDGAGSVEDTAARVWQVVAKRLSL